jgi:hypothetical protein
MHHDICLVVADLLQLGRFLAVYLTRAVMNIVVVVVVQQ